MKTGPAELQNLFYDELHACDTAANLIEKFNKLQVVDKPVKLNRPEVWQYTVNSKLILIEPYIENFRKFNSNTGWVAKEEHPWVQILQALSHFSYHASGGACVLCDLQGAIYDEFVVLTDPVIMSRTAEFGATDMGPNGTQHACCDSCPRPIHCHPVHIQREHLHWTSIVLYLLANIDGVLESCLQVCRHQDVLPQAQVQRLLQQGMEYTKRPKGVLSREGGHECLHIRWKGHRPLGYG